MISERFIIAARLNKRRLYQIAQEAGIHPSTLSKLLCGISKVEENDHRVIAVGRVLGLAPNECFQGDAL